MVELTEGRGLLCGKFIRDTSRKNEKSSRWKTLFAKAKETFNRSGKGDETVGLVQSTYKNENLLNMRGRR